jgi:hypothetical protein
MVKVSPRMARRLSPPLMLVLPVVLFALDFVFLLVTYLVLASIVPGMLGEVAVSPARFAAWIALVQTPMSLAHMVVASWRRWMAMVSGGEVPDPPVRRGWRRVLAWGTHAAWLVLAALIVFGRVADPGDAHVGLLVAVTALGPLLLPRFLAGSVRLLRRRGAPRTA